MRAPGNTPAERQRRRERVKGSICKRGHVCNGLGLCRCNCESLEERDESRYRATLRDWEAMQEDLLAVALLEMQRKVVKNG